MLFRYKAVDIEGKVKRGRIDALNTSDLEMRLRHMGLELITCTPTRHGPLLLRKIPRTELINFCFHLEQLTQSGIPLIEGLIDLRDSTEHRRFREIIAQLIENIEGGQTLSEAMSSHREAFSPVFVNLIRAGESSGRLSETLTDLAESLKWDDELASHIRRLLLHPSFVGLVVLSTSLFLMTFLVPQLKHFVRMLGQTLPLHTQALFFVSDRLVIYWPALLIFLLSCFAGLQIMQRHPMLRVHLDGFKLMLPIIDPILQKAILSRFANTFAMLYASGIPIIESIRTTQHIVGNRRIRQALQNVEYAIHDGQRLTAAFQEARLFPPLVVRMLRIGENTGGLDKALRNVSYFYTRDVKESVAKAQVLIEPILTLVMGTLLGWVVLSVIGPIYDMISRVKL